MKKANNKQPETNLPFDINKPLNTNTELIFNRIENDIKSSFYAPPPAFIKAINQMKINTPKDYVVAILKPVFDKLTGMTFTEKVNINVNEVLSSVMFFFQDNTVNLTDTERQEFDDYQNHLFKTIIYGVVCDIRKIKGSGIDADKELGMALNFMSNLANDAKYLYGVDIYETEISYLKNEIEKPNNTISNSTPVNKHPEIFVDGYGYELFKAWHEKHSWDAQSHLANYSFLIRSMINDKLIIELKQSTYLDFLSKYDISVSRVKSLTDCTTNVKNELYLEVKKSIYALKK